MQELRISGKQVNVIDGVQLFDKIETLHITRSSVVDMTALAQCPHLRHLSLEDSIQVLNTSLDAEWIRTIIGLDFRKYLPFDLYRSPI